MAAWGVEKLYFERMVLTMETNLLGFERIEPDYSKIGKRELKYCSDLMGLGRCFEAVNVDFDH